MHKRINQDKMKSKLLSAGVAILRTVLLVGFSYIILHPIILMISKAFMAQEDVFDNSVLDPQALHPAESEGGLRHHEI